MEIKSFVLYVEYYQHLSHLSDEDLGKLFRAIFNYVIDGKIPTEKSCVGMAFSFIKTDIDNNIEKYLKICERNRTNGNKKKKKEKATGSQSEAKKASGLSGKPKAYNNDNDNDNDNENYNENENNENKAKEKINDFYEKFRSKYPQWTTPIPTPAFKNALMLDEFENIMKGLEHYCDDIIKNKKQNFIKNAENWLNEQLWKKDYGNTAFGKIKISVEEEQDNRYKKIKYDRDVQKLEIMPYDVAFANTYENQYPEKVKELNKKWGL